MGGVDGLAYRPRREAIDLGTDDSVEELRGAFGQFQRAEHESGRSQDQFGTTATERLQPIRGQGLGDRALCDADALVRQAGVIGRPDRMEREGVLLLLDQLDPALHSAPSVNQQMNVLGDGIDPPRKALADLTKPVHRNPTPVRSPPEPLLASSRQYKT